MTMTPSAFLRRAHIKQLLTHNTTTQNEKNKEVAVHQTYLLLPPEDMLSERKFSYASVKEEQGMLSSYATCSSNY
jgi:hypothetical protein